MQSSPQKVVIIGGVALGPKVASRLKRLQPQAQVTMLDAGANISYGGCGIPYFVSGEVGTLAALKSTTYGTERTPEYFKTSKDIEVKNHTLALKIDRQAKTVLTKNLLTGATETLNYDQLVLATGSKPRGLQVPGIELAGISNATNLEEAEQIQKACASGKVNEAVVVGGSFIGLEMAVAIAEMWGIKVSVVEFMPQLLPGVVSESVGDMAKADLEKHDIKVYTTEKVLEFKGQGQVSQVVTDQRVLEAQLVVMATGAIPNVSLAQDCDLRLEAGGIWVNEYLQTSDPNIYAGGDCVSILNLITQKYFCLAMGSLANRQGRIIGTNLAAGTRQSFKGAVGSFAIKLFDLSICGTGLSINRAKSAGFEAVSTSIEQLDKAHFYPEKSMMHLELVVDAPSRRILGLQGAGPNADALKARIDACATMLQFGQPTIEDLEVAEIAYAPPFASAMDILNTVANTADNMLSGQLRSISSKKFSELWDNRAENKVFFIDARPAQAGQATAKDHPDWHSIPLEEINSKAHEIPKDRPIAIICNVGLRAYESMLLLNQKGLSNSVLASGGMQALIKRGYGL